jgi:hypothetical protein
MNSAVHHLSTNVWRNVKVPTPVTEYYYTV